MDEHGKLSIPRHSYVRDFWFSDNHASSRFVWALARVSWANLSALLGSLAAASPRLAQRPTGRRRGRLLYLAVLSHTTLSPTNLARCSQYDPLLIPMPPYPRPR